MVLIELKKSFSLYSDFWHLWRHTEWHGLTNVEIEIIEIYRQSNFVILPSHTDMFYDKAEVLNFLFKPLSEKLYHSYDDYKEWVACKFAGFLNSQIIKFGFANFCKVDIDQLPIFSGTRDKLKKFGFPNLDDFITCYSDADLRQEDNFKILLSFKDEIEDFVEWQQL